MQTPKHTHEVVATYKGKEIIVVGNVYDKPLKETEHVRIYAKVEFLLDGVPIHNLCSDKQLTEEQNKAEVEKIAAGIDKILDHVNEPS